MNNINLEIGWKNELYEEFKSSYMIGLKKFLIEEKKSKIIYPQNKNIFRAFNETPLNNVKVVIISQDPYHGKNQANGLAFSVNEGINLPPTLINIYKELYNDLKISQSKSGYLLPWAKQGVLLLNSILTVEENKPLSHAHKGWEIFTDKAISILNKNNKPIIFLLWGYFSNKKTYLINCNKHIIISSSHPSPYSANKSFFNSKPFSKVNFYLKKLNQPVIDWKIK
ncbi:MAG: uracil-DNA glycosylase [Candidatus Azosocius agrarius]|nr:MAG: uracil-DNA glycosylase [Gammaproteobacteria bacterium]